MYGLSKNAASLTGHGLPRPIQRETNQALTAAATTAALMTIVCIGHSLARRNSWALTATITVLTDKKLVTIEDEDGKKVTAEFKR